MGAKETFLGRTFDYINVYILPFYKQRREIFDRIKSRRIFSAYDDKPLLAEDGIT